MATIYHKFNIRSTDINKVFKALTEQDGLAGWWTKHVKAKPEEGSVAVFQFSPDYEKHMKVEKLTPNEHLKWKCIKGDEQWVGTTLTFDLELLKDSTDVHFRHSNWQEQTPLFGLCSYHWALYMKSLKDLIEHGNGNPHSM